MLPPRLPYKWAPKKAGFFWWIPGGKSKLAFYAAALWLIKEEREFTGTNEELQESFLTFLESDWKKNDGFKIASQMSKAENFYRQDYCGCVYSKLAREKVIQARKNEN